MQSHADMSVKCINGMSNSVGLLYCELDMTNRLLIKPVTLFCNSYIVLVNPFTPELN
jgi:hypothetical protein